MILADAPSSARRELTLADCLTEGESRLRARGLEAPRAESERLLAHALGLERQGLWRLAPGTPLPRPARRAWRRLLHRRLAGEPFAYLAGRREFWSLTLEVRPGVLVPRPETEALVAAAESLLPAATRARLLDLGTGSGALALALGTLFPEAEIWATDHSPQALAVAEENARRLGQRIRLRQGDWYGALPPGLRFRLVVSNPPYLAADDPALRGDGLRREPREALVAPGGGLGDLRRIVAGAPARLEAGGWLLLEHAPAQTAAVATLLRQGGFEPPRPILDPGGRPVGSAGRLAGTSGS